MKLIVETKSHSVHVTYGLWLMDEKGLDHNKK